MKISFIQETFALPLNFASAIRVRFKKGVGFAPRNEKVDLLFLWRDRPLRC